MKVDNNRVLKLLYKNWKGETSVRRVQPVGNLYWGQTEYHKEDQWLFDVWDLDKEDHRTYAFKDIVSMLVYEV